MSDLHSQLVAKLGIEVADVPQTPSVTVSDPLSSSAHQSSDWVVALTAAVARAGMGLKPSPSLGAVRCAHDVLVKRLKANGDKRSYRHLNELRARYEKKREKLAWAQLKSQLAEAGVSPKLYRAIKSGSSGPEVVLGRWVAVAGKGFNQADLRAALLGG